jgi:hypothetical protein
LESISRLEGSVPDPVPVPAPRPWKHCKAERSSSGRSD